MMTLQHILCQPSYSTSFSMTEVPCQRHSATRRSLAQWTDPSCAPTPSSGVGEDATGEAKARYSVALAGRMRLTILAFHVPTSLGGSTE